MRKTNPYIAGFIFILLIITLAVSYFMNQTRRLIAVDDQVLGTYVTIKAYARDESKTRKILLKALAEMKRIDQEYDIYHKNSEITKLNLKAGAGPVKVSEELFNLLDNSIVDSQRTDSNFNPAIGPLMKLWDFSKSKKPPDEFEIEKGLKKTRPGDIVLNEQNMEVSLEKGYQFDLGGILKGYAVDRAISIIKKEGLENVLVDLGSSQGALGKKPNRKNWKVGIQNPKLDDSSRPFIGYLELDNFSYVSTSGDYQQSFTYQGKKYHHILDPKTGWPATDYRSVTVVSKNSAFEADLLSTAVFAGGYPEGLRLLKKYPGTESIYVLKDGLIKSSISEDKDIEILFEKIK